MNDPWPFADWPAAAAVLLVEVFLVLVILNLWWGRRRAEETAKGQAAELTGLRLEAKRRSDALSEVLVPITWAWDEQDGQPRLRHHLVQALLVLQGGLAADDVEMTDRMGEVPDPPRRLPKYAQVPPFLATPEDVAQVPLQMVKDHQPVEEAMEAMAEADQLREDAQGLEDFQRGPTDPFAGMGHTEGDQ